MGHLIIQLNGSAENALQVNGSFKQMGHLSEWVIQLNGSAEKGFQVNGSFKQMGYLSEWVIQLNGSFDHSTEWVC